MRNLILILIGALTLCSCGNAPDSNQDVAPVKVIYDVPALIRLNTIEQVRSALGKPKDKLNMLEPTELQMHTKGFDTWDNSFTNDSFELQVTYNPHTRKVIDFFIGFVPPKESSDNDNIYKKAANVVDGSKDYSIQSIHQNTDPSKYTGIIIKPI